MDWKIAIASIVAAYFGGMITTVLICRQLMSALKKADIERVESIQRMIGGTQKQDQFDN